MYSGVLKAVRWEQFYRRTLSWWYACNAETWRCGTFAILHDHHRRSPSAQNKTLLLWSHHRTWEHRHSQLCFKACLLSGSRQVKVNNHKLKTTGLIEQLLHVSSLVLLARRFFQRGEELIETHGVSWGPVTCSDSSVGFGCHRTLPEERFHQWPQMTRLQRLQQTDTPASKTKDLMEHRGKTWSEINMCAQSHTASDDYHEIHGEKETQKSRRRFGRERQRVTETPCGANSNCSCFLNVS